MAPRISGIARTTIFCRDLDKSLALYRDVLGLQMVEDKTLNGAAIGRLIGLDTCRLRIVHLRAEGQSSPLIGLYAVLDPVLPETTPAGPGLHRGNVAIVLHSSEPEAIARDLRAGGYAFLTPPTEYEIKTAGAAGGPGIVTEMIFTDPDGVLVSIMGFRPS